MELASTASRQQQEAAFAVSTRETANYELTTSRIRDTGPDEGGDPVS